MGGASLPHPYSTLSLPLPPYAALQQQAHATARAALGDDAYAVIWAAGQAMPLEAAITLVLDTAALD